MQEQENVRMHVVVVTGMSGSGKSVVMDVLEDIGYYCIDNLPPQLIGKFVEICRSQKTTCKSWQLPQTCVPAICSQMPTGHCWR